MTAPVVRPYLVGLADMASTATALDDSFGWNWRAEINEAGYGEISLHHTDPLLDLIELPNSFVHYFVDDAYAFTVMLERWQSVDVAGNPKELLTKFVGRGPGQLYDRIAIDPSGGPDRLPIQEDRTWDYTADGFDDSDWDNGTEVCTVAQAQAEWPAGTTVGATLWDPDFADPDASVIWTSEGTPAGAEVKDVYMRDIAPGLAAGQYQLQVLIDNVGLAYFDNSLILTPGQSSDSNYSGWTRASTFVLDVTAGDHVIAFKATNLGGPAGLAATLCPTDSDGFLGDPVWSTSTNTKVLAATEPPGMTFGEVWEIVDGEQTARAVDPLDPANFTAYSFDAVNDSNGNPWDKATISTKVGTSDLSFLREASGTYIDFRIVVDFDAGKARLDAYRKGEMGGTPGVSYHTRTDPDDETTGNLASMRRTGEGLQGNAFLGRWGGGWTRRIRQSSIDAVGRWETPLSIGATNDIAEARRVLDGQLDEFATNRTQTDASLRPTGNGDVPWRDYSPDGATVDLQGESHRILAASCAVDDETGHPHFALTLNDSVVLSFEERMAQLAGRLLRGSLGGRSTVVTAPIPRFIPLSIGVGEGCPTFSESFNKADGALGPDLSWTVFSYGTDVAVEGNRAHKQFTNAAFDGSGARADDAVLDNDSYAQLIVGPIDADFYTKGVTYYLRTRGTTNAPPASSDEFFEGYHASFQAAVGQTAVSFYKAEAGDFLTQLGSASFPTVEMVEGTVLRLEVQGESLTAKINGATVKTATDSSITTGTRAGFVFAITNIPGIGSPVDVYADSFECGDLC